MSAMSNTLGIQRNAIAQQSPAERESMLASIHSRNAATTPKTIGRREQTAVEAFVDSRSRVVDAGLAFPGQDRCENELTKKPKRRGDATNATCNSSYKGTRSIEISSDGILARHTIL